MGQSWWLQQLAGVAAVGLWLALLAVAAIGLQRMHPEQAGSDHGREWSRKLVHIGTGAVVPLAWLLGVDRLIAVPAAMAVTVLAAINHRYRLLPAIEDVGRHSYGTVAYGAAITSLLLAFWPQQADAVCAGVLVMALGDGLAGLLGARFRSPSWQLGEQRKSLLGTTTMAVVSMVVLLLLAQGPWPAPPPAALVAIALVATALEQVAWMGIDNLTVPIVSAWLWSGWR
ncbi:MAG: dolichol kinase [Synechococcaceae bacterium WB9_2_112]|nr:dolichol kinase [Synechococcaceae bacterium WB9_2_112]